MDHFLQEAGHVLALKILPGPSSSRHPGLALEMKLLAMLFVLARVVKEKYLFTGPIETAFILLSTSEGLWIFLQPAQSKG